MRFEAPLADLVPPAWRGGQLWVSSYRMYCVTLEQLADLPRFELLGVLGHFIWGGAPYFAVSQKLRAQPEGHLVVEMEVDTVRHADDGPYLLLMGTHHGRDASGSR